MVHGFERLGFPQCLGTIGKFESFDTSHAYINNRILNKQAIPIPKQAIRHTLCSYFSKYKTTF